MANLTPFLPHSSRIAGTRLVLDRDVDQVDQVRHVEHRLEGLERADVAALGVDREDRTLVAVVREVLDDDVADGVGVGRCADDRDPRAV